MFYIVIRSVFTFPLVQCYFLQTALIPFSSDNNSAACERLIVSSII